MQKTRKIISMLLAVMMIFSMCAVGMASASALPENAVISDVEGNDASGIDGEVFGLMGDADGNGKVNVKDATEIQKFAAKLIKLDEKCEALADVDLNGKVNVKDATAIQKWIAKIAVDMPIGKLVYFPNQSTTESVPTTTVASDDETEPATTAASSPDETEPVSTAPSVPVIVIIPTDATDPSESATATDNTEATTEATKPSSATQATTTDAGDATEATTTTAAATVPNVKTVTVYFTNNLNWEAVNVHAWNGNGDLTTWPGVAMTFYKTNSQGQDVYKYTFTDDVDGVVFNGFADPGNTKDKSLQTASIKGDAFKGDGYGYWCTGEKDSSGKQLVDSYKVEDQQTTTASAATGDETTIASQATTASQPAKTLTVYFTNNLNWSVVNVHAWNGSGDLTTFPGVAMTYYKTNSQGQDIYKYTFDTDDIDGVMFDGFDDPQNTSNKALQTASIKGDDFKGDGYGYWCKGELDSKGRQLVESYKVEDQQTTTTTASAATGDETTTATQATTASQPAKVLTVYFTNNLNWSVVNVHAWNGSGDLTTFPGVAMTLYKTNSQGQDVYMYTFDTDDVDGVIFDGYADPDNTKDKSMQTASIKGDEFKGDGYGYWCKGELDSKGRQLVESYKVEDQQTTTESSATSGDNTTDSTEASTETTTASKPADTITVYFTNKNNWDVVNIHCWNSTGSITTWPGDAMTFYRTNSMGQDVYTYEVSLEATHIGFNGFTDPDNTNDKSLQSANVTGDELKDGYGYYPSGRANDGRWTLDTWNEEGDDNTQPSSNASSVATEPSSSTQASSSAAAATVTITFNGAKTTWINDASAYFVLVDLDTNKSYTMTNIGSYKWTAEVPETVNNVKFTRCNPSNAQVWNSWTAKDRGTALQYNTTSSSAGAWEGDTSIKYYVMGSFNSWSAGTAMTANADGSYTQEIALEAGSYQYKIATADWTTEYPSGYGNNATLTVETAGTYVFTLTSSGAISAVAK